MSTIINAHQIFYDNCNCHKSTCNSRRKSSPQAVKQYLVSQVCRLTQANNKLQAKQQALKNTINDLKKLIWLTNEENQQNIQHLHHQIEKIQTKKEQYEAVLTYVQGNDIHLQKCMLFWDLLA